MWPENEKRATCTHSQRLWITWRRRRDLIETIAQQGTSNHTRIWGIMKKYPLDNIGWRSLLFHPFSYPQWVCMHLLFETQMKISSPRSSLMTNGGKEGCGTIVFRRVGVHRSHFVNEQRVLPWAPLASLPKLVQVAHSSCGAAVRLDKPLRPDWKWIVKAPTRNPSPQPTENGPTSWKQLVYKIVSLCCSNSSL